MSFSHVFTQAISQFVEKSQVYSTQENAQEIEVKSTTIQQTSNTQFHQKSVRKTSSIKIRVSGNQ